MRLWMRPLTILMGIAVVSANQPPELQILVIGGEGSINNVKQRTAREPVIEVRDRNNRPVAGALILFEAPRNGASGTFIGGSPTLRVTTDAQGRAVGQGFRPNNTGGDFGVQVTANYQGLTATATVHMTNFVAAGAAAGAAAGHGKLIGILIGVGAAAAAGTAYAVTHSGSGSGTGSSTPPAATPTTITAGTGSVGGRP